MTKEQKILNMKFGKENHFTVPEGYFDSFAETMMDRLPHVDGMEARVIEMKHETLWHRLSLRKLAAAVAVVMLMGTGYLLYAHLGLVGSVKTQSAMVGETSVERQQSVGTEYGTFDQMADYTMMDNQDIYASLVASNSGGL